MRLVLSILFILFLSQLKAQFSTDTIALETNFKGFQFIYLGEQINAMRVMEILEVNELALDEFNSSREAYVFGNIFAMIGSALIVYPFVNSALGYKTNYGPAFAGVCFIGISIPIFRSYNKKTISSISKYNNGLGQIPANKIQGQLNFGGTSSGIGFKYSF